MNDQSRSYLAEGNELSPSTATAESPDDAIAFSSSDYATDEEAYAALEVFLMKAFGAR